MHDKAQIAAMETAQGDSVNAMPVADVNPPAYPLPPNGPFPGQQYPSQPGQPLPIPLQAAQPGAAGPMDPAMAAAIAGQQYRDQLFAQCAMGNHERVTDYGVLGIITAVVCFPCGLICLFADTKHKCQRCGVSLTK